uniref:Uncharacterized protein LOC110212068 isoform X2 n=1 Tax=Phascolarctos cinereus TaxID=38626 RepID=A0A6P5KUU8_PHACI|nr:uncharacterized protein LOC110212068 isoform X2 [Phascolarctos cinereus]
MGSTQKSSMSQTAKMTKASLKVSAPMQRGPEVNHSVSPHRGPSASQRGADLSRSVSPQRGMESRQTSQRGVDTPQSASPQYGLDFSRISSSQGNESISHSQGHLKAEATHHGSPQYKHEHGSVPHGNLLAPSGRAQMKYDGTSYGGTHRTQSPPTQDQTHKNVAAPGQESHRNILPSDAKITSRALYSNPKESTTVPSSQWDVEPPPSKVTNPQGVRSPRRCLINPKDESTQTDFKKNLVYSEGKSVLRKPPSSDPTHTALETKPTQRTMSVQESQAGPRSTVHAETKGSHRNLGSLEVESAVKVSFRKDPDHPQKVAGRSEVETVQRQVPSPTRVAMAQEAEAAIKSSARSGRESRRVTILTESDASSPSPCQQPSEPSHKPPILSSSFKPPSSEASVKVATVTEPELIPRPLPPRSLPKYDPESSWWILFHPEPPEPPKCETVLTQSEHRPTHLDLFMSQIGIASAYCEELIIQSEKATSPEPQSPRTMPSCDLLKSTWQPLESSESVEDGTIQRFSAFFLDVTDEMLNRVIWWLKDDEIKRFLEDTEEAELAVFVKEFPGGDVPHPESMGPSQLCLPAILDPYEESETKESRSSSRIQPETQAHLCISSSSVLSISSRPRSPWGRLDPYDSCEDDKEYVGFATLPNQVHRKSMKKGFDFTLMVAGESGLGKSTLINSLFLTDMYRDRRLLNSEERIMQTVEITKHTMDIEEKGVKLKLTVVDTPGFGDAVNNTECWKPVADYIDQQFEQYFRDESGLNRKNIQDNRVHCCLYFISPFGHGLRPLDVEFMRALHHRVNIVPILAKADTLTPNEVEHKKRKIREEIEHFGIQIYQFPACDSDEDEEFKLQDQALKDSIPFAVIGSNTVVEAKGRRVRGRLYPWGIVEVENPGHCDFVKLRTMLVRTHMQDLKDVTREIHYENYRAQCIQSMTRMVVKERNRNKLTRENISDFAIPAAFLSGIDIETEKMLREKDEELRRMQEMLYKIQRQKKEKN